jgi:hypothetical protein
MEKIMSNHNEILYNLIYNRSYRNLLEHYCAAGWPINDFLPIDAPSRFLNMNEIKNYAALVRKMLDDANATGTNQLSQAFKLTISNLLAPTQGVCDLLAEFIESANFLCYVQLEPYQTGVCLEEAFFNFAQQRFATAGADITQWTTLLHEYYRTQFQALTACTNPVFSTESFYSHRCGNGYAKILNMRRSLWQKLAGTANKNDNLESREDVLILYFGGPRFVSGPISEQSADIINNSMLLTMLPPAQRHGILRNLYQNSIELEKFITLEIA